jgi:hypothetical protein
MLDNKKSKVLVVSTFFLIKICLILCVDFWQSTISLHLFVSLQGIHDLNEKYRHLLPFLGKTLITAGPFVPLRRVEPKNIFL